MNNNEKRLIDANIKLQDENNVLKYEISRANDLIEQIKTYISINKTEDGKINSDSILEMIGEYIEK